MRFELEGVHFIANGSIFAFAETAQCVAYIIFRTATLTLPRHRHGSDIRLLPGLVPQWRLNDTARVIEAELLAREARIKERLNSGNIEEDSEGWSSCVCSTTIH